MEGFCKKMPGAFFHRAATRRAKYRECFEKKCLEHFFIAQRPEGQNTGSVLKKNAWSIFSSRSDPKGKTQGCVL
jgi:hypothetical protein